LLELQECFSSSRASTYSDSYSTKARGAGSFRVAARHQELHCGGNMSMKARRAKVGA